LFGTIEVAAIQQGFCLFEHSLERGHVSHSFRE
jgi:hypothetical protein